jgi:hypothetical protein
MEEGQEKREIRKSGEGIENKEERGKGWEREGKRDKMLPI